MNKYTQILMQYETPLPDDFAMGDIRKRALNKAPLFDQRPGLEFKLYAVNTLEDSSVNEYSSIYLWNDLEAYRGFLSGDLFDNYAKAFARPSVRSWVIHEIRGEREALRNSCYLLRQIVPLPREAHIGEFLDRWTRRQNRSDTLYHMVGFDPFQWHFIDITVWKAKPELRDSSHRYSLIGVSFGGKSHESAD
jgi:heme-degrading monooxygenase HmoA